MLHLVLSHDSPRNTTISNLAGQALYRSSTPFKWYGRTTTISKVIPNESEDDMRDRFVELAQLEWYGPRTSVFRYRGGRHLVKDFFKREDKWKGRRRSFTASDGSSYVWIIGTLVPSLELNDSTKTIIAHPHRWRLGLGGEARKAYIEISPCGEHILDDIVVSWVFAEIVRRARGGGG